MSTIQLGTLTANSMCNTQSQTLTAIMALTIANMNTNLRQNGKGKCYSSGCVVSFLKKLRVVVYNFIKYIGREGLWKSNSWSAFFSCFCEHWRHLNGLLYQEGFERRGTVPTYSLRRLCSPPFPLPDVQYVKLQPWWSQFTVRPSRFPVVLRDGILSGLAILSWWYEILCLVFVIVADCPSYLCIFPIQGIPIICIVRRVNLK